MTEEEKEQTEWEEHFEKEQIDYQFKNNCYCIIEQYHLLKRCSDAKNMTKWNAWRKENPEEKIVLQGADMKKWRLAYADLHGAYLTSANCQNANFMYANCQQADFSSANCQNANFMIVELQKADFRKADCRNTNFERVDVPNAHFGNANCQWADFRGANCQWAIFRNADCQDTNFERADVPNADFGNANCQWANFEYANCETATFSYANCQNADFNKANCQNANFNTAHCQRANFENTNCQNVDFKDLDCQKANFSYANCQGGDFSFSRCEGANFTAITVDHTIRFTNCTIDDDTDFSHISLSSIIIEAGTRAKLEHNVRRKNWEKWYGKGIREAFQQLALYFYDIIVRHILAPLLHLYHVILQRILPLITKIIGQDRSQKLRDANTDYHKNTQTEEEEETIEQDAPLLPQIFKDISRALYSIPVRIFWHISDYGYSTVRVLYYFLAATVFFTWIYYCFPEILAINGQAFTAENVQFWQMLAFAFSTMVTLGFSNINVAIDAATNVANPWGTLAVTANLMTGYFMLAVLVTRMAILFQSMSPGLVVPKKPKKSKGKEEKN